MISYDLNKYPFLYIKRIQEINVLFIKLGYEHEHVFLNF